MPQRMKGTRHIGYPLQIWKNRRYGYWPPQVASLVVVIQAAKEGVDGPIGTPSIVHVLNVTASIWSY